MSSFIVPKSMLLRPKCVHCKFYKPGVLSGPAECKKFARVSSEKDIKYEFAEICRETIDMCGRQGLYFELKELIDFID